MCSLPLRHRRQRPQYSVEMQCTASPTATLRRSCASGPISITSPEISWPSTHGASMRRSPLKNTRTSVPQMPVAVTRSSTPSLGQTGSGTVPRVILPGPCQIAARNVSTPSCRTTCRPAVTLSGMSEFIFMLTRNDVTLSDARSIYASIADTGLRHIGCKDVGLPQDELKAFMDEIRANGHTSYLEVVSETEEATLRSAEVAAAIGPTT